MNEKELTQTGLQSLSENELTSVDGGLSIIRAQDALAILGSMLDGFISWV